MSSVPTLGYWDMRGLGEPIRYLLHYVGVPFNDKRYQYGPGRSLADLKKIQSPWFPDKEGLGLDFPNLPYYIEGDLKLTQSTTILRYLGRKHGLIAKNDEELVRQELVEQQMMHMKWDLALGVIFHPDYEERKPAYIQDKLIPQLEALAKFLSSNQWITSELSYADFLAYETLDWFRLFSADTFAKFPVLEQYLLRFENLEPIKEYRQSPDYKSWPIFLPIMYWGSIK